MSDRRRVVVTGLGVINAAGTTVDRFWHAVRDGKTRLSMIDRFDATGFPIQVAGQVGDFDATKLIPRRFVAKTDRFTHFVLASAAEAIRSAGLDLATEDLGRVGVWFGNNTGGWDLCEQGFREYYVDGADVVNPWQATAWFLAAPQGFTTIRYGIRGMSKSFAGDRTSGACACYYGVRSVSWGRTDVVLTGGCEAPVTPLALLCLHSSGDFSSATDPEHAYRPFDGAASGLVVGEGGVVLVVEEAERSAARGATAFLEVLGGAHGTVPDRNPAGCAAVVRRALADADCAPGDIGMILCEGTAIGPDDRFEATALADVFAASGPVPIAVPKSIFGHLYGAGFGTDVLCGALALRDGIVPATPGYEHGDLPDCLRLSAEERPLTADRFLVLSHSRYGGCVAMVFGRPIPTRGA